MIRVCTSNIYHKLCVGRTIFFNPKLRFFGFFILFFYSCWLSHGKKRSFGPLLWIIVVSKKNPACQDIFWPENPNDEWLKKTRVQYIIYSIRCVTHISSWGGKRDGKKSSPSAQNLRVTAISTRGIPKIFWKFYLCIYFKIYICNVYIYMALARKFKRTFLSQRLFFHFSLPSPWKGIDLKCPRRVLWKDNLIKTQLKDFVELHKWFFAKFWL